VGYGLIYEAFPITHFFLHLATFSYKLPVWETFLIVCFIHIFGVGQDGGMRSLNDRGFVKCLTPPGEYS